MYVYNITKLGKLRWEMIRSDHVCHGHHGHHMQLLMIRPD